MKESEQKQFNWKDHVTNERIIILVLAIMLTLSMIFNFVFLTNNKTDRDTVDNAIELLDKFDLEDESVSDEKNIDDTIAWLENELGMYYECAYDDESHSIVMYLSDRGAVRSFTDTMNGELPVSEWDEFFIVMNDLSKIITRRTADDELSLTLTSPLNENTAVYIAKNGKTEFNGFDAIGLE